MRLTVQEALHLANTRLVVQPGLRENARRDAQQLVEIATGLTRVHMLAAPERYLNDAEAARLEQLIEQRLRFLPIQYLRGSQEFYGRNFTVTPDVLIPRPETELIVDEVLRRTPDRGTPLRIADVGTGSGILAITLILELPHANVTALDISREALGVARQNAQALAADSARLCFLHSDLLSAVPGEQFDLIVSNPPYIPLRDAPELHPQVRDHEPHLALFGGPGGLDVIRRLLSEAWLALKPGGVLLMETAGRTPQLDAMWHDWTNVHYSRDLQGMERIAVAHRLL